VRPWPRWSHLWKAILASGEARPAFDRLAARYVEPGRAYHTMRHVLSCLTELDRVRRTSAQPLAVEFALWFHDAVYDPKAPDNEARSAALLREEARLMRIDVGLAQQAVALIGATAHLGVEGYAPVQGDAALVRDIDLAVLGSSPRRFDAYDRGIRREYSHLSEAEWISGRKTVLEGFLGLRRIYATDIFRDRLEARARSNLSRGLARLSVPGGGSPASPPPR